MSFTQRLRQLGCCDNGDNVKRKSFTKQDVYEKKSISSSSCPLLQQVQEIINESSLTSLSLTAAQLTTIIMDIAPLLEKVQYGIKEVPNITIHEWKRLAHVAQSLQVDDGLFQEDSHDTIQKPNEKTFNFLNGNIMKMMHETKEIKPFLEEKAPSHDDITQWFLTSCSTTAACSQLWSGNELAKTILDLSHKSSSLEVFQTHLFDLLGATDMEWLMKLGVHQQELKCISYEKLVETASVQKIEKSPEKVKRSTQRARKQEKKLKGDARVTTTNDTTWLEEANYDLSIAAVQREEHFLKNDPRQLSPGATSGLKQAFGDIKGGFVDSGIKTGLPKGTLRTQFKKYEKVFIPILKKENNYGAKSSVLIPVTALEEIIQPVFSGITHFNRLQSELFEIAYHTSENLLVCAPTGAGKTNCALLSIVREAHKRLCQFKKNDPNLYANFKIVYVAPMKALAQEIVGVSEILYFILFAHYSYKNL